METKDIKLQMLVDGKWVDVGCIISDDIDESPGQLENNTPAVWAGSFYELEPDPVQPSQLTAWAEQRLIEMFIETYSTAKNFHLIQRLKHGKRKMVRTRPAKARNRESRRIMP